MLREHLFGCMVMIHTVTSAISFKLEDVHAVSFCGSLGCANNSTCRTTLTNNEIEGSHVTYSECVCKDDWIGPKCDHHLSLKLLRHEIDVVQLSAGVTYVDSQVASQTRRPKMKDFDLKFNVQYWSNGSGAMCNIMTQVRRRQFEITGLKLGSFYSICVSAVDVDLCFLKDQRPAGRMPNCVRVWTPSSNETLLSEEVKKISPVVAPLSLTIFFVILLVIIVVILVRCKTVQYCRENAPAIRRRILTAPRDCKCPCLSSVSTEPRPEPRSGGWLVSKTANGRFKNYNKRRHPHPTTIPLTTILEYKSEEAETSASPLVVCEPEGEGRLTEEKS